MTEINAKRLQFVKGQRFDQMRHITIVFRMYILGTDNTKSRPIRRPWSPLKASVRRVSVLPFWHWQHLSLAL